MDVGGSFNRALERFKPNVVPLIIGVVAVWGINLVLTVVPTIVINGVLDGGFIAASLSALVTAAVGIAITGPLWGGLYTMIGKAYLGATPEVSDLAIATKSGRLNEFLIVGAVLASPSILNVIPIAGPILAFPVQIVVWFLFIPAMIMVAEGSDAKSALSRSKELTSANAKTFFLTYLVAGLVSIFFVTIPIGLLMIMDTYFSLKGGQAAGMQPQPPQYPEQGGFPPG